MKARIDWEKWRNPLGGGEEYGAEEACEDAISAGEVDTRIMVRPVVPTPGGMMPLTVFGNFAANFNFWMMNTNFNISARVVDQLRVFPGVESLDVVGRYSARVGFGKCFDDAVVRAGIDRMLSVGDGDEGGPVRSRLVLDDATRKVVSMLREHGAETSKWWVIYVLPNGEVAFGRSDRREEYDDIAELYRRSQQLAGGVVITNNDV